LSAHQVAGERPAVLDLAAGGDFDSLLQTLVGLHLRHCGSRKQTSARRRRSGNLTVRNGPGKGKKGGRTMGLTKGSRDQGIEASRDQDRAIRRSKGLGRSNRS